MIYHASFGKKKKQESQWSTTLLTWKRKKNATCTNHDTSYKTADYMTWLARFRTSASAQTSMKWVESGSRGKKEKLINLEMKNTVFLYFRDKISVSSWRLTLGRRFPQNTYLKEQEKMENNK